MTPVFYPGDLVRNEVLTNLGENATYVIMSCKLSSCEPHNGKFGLLLEENIDDYVYDLIVVGQCRWKIKYYYAQYLTKNCKLLQRV